MCLWFLQSLLVKAYSFIWGLITRRRVKRNTTITGNPKAYVKTQHIIQLTWELLLYLLCNPLILMSLHSGRYPMPLWLCPTSPVYSGWGGLEDVNTGLLKMVAALHQFGKPWPMYAQCLAFFSAGLCKSFINQCTLLSPRGNDHMLFLIDSVIFIFVASHKVSVWQPYFEIHKFI